jgi:rRNA-processing protein FCF1
MDLLHFLIKRTRNVNTPELVQKLGDGTNSKFALLTQCCITNLEDIKNRKRKLKYASKVLNLFIDSAKCLKLSSEKSKYLAEVDKCAEEMLQITKKLSNEKELKQLKERVKHLKMLIQM